MAAPTLTTGTIVTVKREVESLELTRPNPMMNVRLAAGQEVRVVKVIGTRVRVATTGGRGYETFVDAKNLVR